MWSVSSKWPTSAEPDLKNGENSQIEESGLESPFQDFVFHINHLVPVDLI